MLCYYFRELILGVNMNSKIGLICVLLAFGVPALEAKPKVHKKAIPTVTDIKTQENKIMELINQERAKEGLRPLTLWESLSDCARRHSQNMADDVVPVGHEGFDLRYKEMKKEAFLT